MITGWRYHFFSPLSFLILIDSILMDLAIECRNFIFKLFAKERRNSLEFSGILSLLSMICFSCLSLFKRLQISYYHLLLAWFFSIFLSYPFGLGWSCGWSNQFWCLQEFFNHIYVPFKCIDWKFFLIEIFLCSLSFLCISLRMHVLIHDFSSSCGNPFFNNFIYTTKFKRVGRLSFSKQIRRPKLEFLSR